MWPVIILGTAAVNFAVGNFMTGAILCVMASAVASLNQILPASDDDEQDDE